MKQLTLSTGETIDVPETRGDCANIPRPCPFNNCRHHLEGEVPKSGEDKESRWFRRVENRRLNLVQESCVLDVVEDDNLSHETRATSSIKRLEVQRGINKVATLLGVSKQMVHNTLKGAMVQLDA